VAEIEPGRCPGGTTTVTRSADLFSYGGGKCPEQVMRRVIHDIGLPGGLFVTTDRACVTCYVCGRRMYVTAYARRRILLFFVFVGVFFLFFVLVCCVLGQALRWAVAEWLAAHWY